MLWHQLGLMTETFSSVNLTVTIANFKEVSRFFLSIVQTIPFPDSVMPRFKTQWQMAPLTRHFS
jgi:hypothetical protein